MTLPSELRSILDSLPEPRLLLRGDFTVAAVNRAFTRRYGLSDVAGRRCYEVLFHQRQSCSQCGQDCPLERAMVSGSTQSGIHRQFLPHSTRLVELDVTPLQRADGHATFFMETVHDYQDTRGLRGNEGVVANSPTVKAALERIALVASLDTPVLFTGETGVGKEVFARLLHENSRRAACPFIRIDSTGLTEALFEEELFGLASMPSNSQSVTRTGLLETASGGTLFFDEISELIPSLQARLMRLIETNTYRCSGSSVMQAVNLRIACSTKRDLLTLVQQDRFREDLAYYLSVYAVEIPKLADRMQDLDDLADILLARSRSGRKLTLSRAAREKLHAWHWPGNVRELAFVLERAAIAAQGPEIGANDIEIRATKIVSSAGVAKAATLTLAEREAAHMRELLNEWKGSRHELAQHLGISERTLYRLIKKSQKI